MIFLRPVQATSNLEIHCITLLAFANLQAQKGRVHVTATGKVCTLGADIQSHLKAAIQAKEGEYLHLEKTPSYDVDYSQLFQKCLHKKDLGGVIDALIEVSQRLDPGLAEENEEVIDVKAALQFWRISI